MMENTLSAGVWETVHAALAKLSRPFPAQALALADAHREDVAPHLVAEIESLAADPSRLDGNSDYMLLDYAMHLLAWWRDPRGLQPLLALAHLRDHRFVYWVLDDQLDEELGRCLGSMARGHLQPLMALADDPHANQYARSSALDAMLVCVIEGDASPETVQVYVRGLAERVAAEVPAEDGESHLLDRVVDLTVSLGMTDMLPAIRGWLDQGLLHPGLSNLHEIEQKLAQPLEPRLQTLREDGHGYMREPETEMGWWNCFDDRPDPALPPVQEFAPPPREPARIISPPPPVQTHVRESPKIGRNDPCHCGSGKKYKMCHGAA